jgi:hypothetical protein
VWDAQHAAMKALGLSEQDIAAITRDNFDRLFPAAVS